MNKPRFETKDLSEENIAKLAALSDTFPGVVTEGKVNFDLLRSLLGDEVFGDEAYEFTWVGKRAAIAESGKPIRKTLRPCIEESKNWDTTENLYIEGDNLDVLKLLQESYLGKVKMIYIDPPYNTGNDFIYRDDFKQSREEYDEESGVYDEDGDRLIRNTESNGRFHSDWCSMIYPRLVLARNMLRDDGIILISIDRNELINLVKICDEVFGASNYISLISVINNPRGRQSDTFIATTNEFLLCYAKNQADCQINGQPLTSEQKSEFNMTDDEYGAYRLLGLRQRGASSLRADRPEMFFPIYVNPLTKEISLEEKPGWECVLPRKSDNRDGRWMWGKEKCKEDHHRLVARKIERRNEYDIFVKDYLVRGDGERSRKFNSVWDDKGYNNQSGTQEVKTILGGDYMSFPKSRALLQSICIMGASKDSIILDFFSGSATTAHAVMQLNAEDGGKRKFIMVQLPEVCAEETDAAKAGYKNICEIGKERIRRAGNKILEEITSGAGRGDGTGFGMGMPTNKTEWDLITKEVLDIGFRVLKLDNTNMKDVFYSAAEVTQDMLAGFESNIKDDRTDMDLLFGCLLDWGLPLSMLHAHETIDGVTIHTYNDGDLIACFADNVSDVVIKKIAERQPLRAVFRDSSFRGSPDKINVNEIFKLMAPNTTVRVI